MTLGSAVLQRICTRPIARLPAALSIPSHLRSRAVAQPRQPHYRFRTVYSDPKVRIRHCSTACADDMGKQNITLKTVKGSRDWAGVDIAVRDKIFEKITSVFKKHGAVSLDTPVFELKEVLAGKYGEDSKLIYDLADQGGEISSLRYDLTVPFARWLAMNPTVTSIKRYHLAKVYRRDQPAVIKGRMREFYQCDFDIAGTYDPMLPDAEILRIAVEILDGLNIGEYTIKLNHRQILDGLFEVCGVPQDKIRPISSAVDKLDKSPWEEVRKEMTEQKGLDPDVADKIGAFVLKKGSRELLEELEKTESLAGNETIKKGLADMRVLFDYLDIFDVTPKVSFDLSLARGLDYYTGVIYEVVTELSAPPSASQNPALTSSSSSKGKRKAKVNKDDPEADRSDDDSVGVGSIAAGGRYDELVGMFSGKGRIPCVGISFGVDRIYSIIRKRLENSTAVLRSSDVDIYVMAMPEGSGDSKNGFLKERMAISKQLWEGGIKAEFLYKSCPKMQAQFKAAEVAGVPFAVIIFNEQLGLDTVRIKELGLPDGHPEKEGIPVPVKDLVEEVKKRLKSTAGIEQYISRLRVDEASTVEAVTK
ncbi:Cytoplasmic and mitochondrial histidine tRNA synthetase [Orbilia brochopaga]|uniref:Histidine--tRNA ligase, mitochondrial n=1 Tax=Orbilia brochopaga TaxID=3140254 RepID=A0AAV9U0Y9_9PEZI